MIIYCYKPICFLNKKFKYIYQVSAILLALFDVCTTEVDISLSHKCLI